ncbi:NOPCHAP1/New4 family protein [Aspergillus homomorphus CBS 101889]|uniref:Uncharacterized protein n=1 Tax=Aspergillus homomorphus (strain CBS 101889) TaxID=1450537 RepID=A0A395HJE2_ASPHC|nr:hypothetical protein BO97DRAFT_446718 [Aspergillus homomorphus CBS 101889]RAL07639.1 hypothetical protein BO97DRAFT_446718 [Aspergillus homomorphus CBS 101889]
MSAPASNPSRDDRVALSSPSAPPHSQTTTAPPHHRPGPNEDDSDDYTSSSGPSDSEDSDDDEGEDNNAASHPPSTTNLPTRNPTTTTSTSSSKPSDTIPRIPALPKPNIHRIQQTPDLLSRLSSFLPQMKTANEQLERDIAAGRAKDIRLDDAMDEGEDADDDEDGQDGKRYIEMNLGLGVLEEKRPDDEIASPAHTHTEEMVLAERPKDSGVLDTLMGNTDATAAAASKPTIEELER